MIEFLLAAIAVWLVVTLMIELTGFDVDDHIGPNDDLLINYNE